MTVRRSIALLGYVWCCTLGALVATPGHAVYPPPIIEIRNATEREVNARVEWLDPEAGFQIDESNDSHTAAGPWNSTVAAVGHGITALGSQWSFIDRFALHGRGAAEASSLGIDFASAFSKIAVDFRIPDDVPIVIPFSFTATFDFSGSPGFGVGNFVGQVGFPTLPSGDGLCGGFTSVDFDDPETWEITCLGAIAPGGQVVFIVTVATTHVGDGTLGTTHASVEFDLNLGDRDHDALLDVWEEEGLDLGEGGVIPLHESELGADPDIKDLFVEVDTLAGAPYSPGLLDQVVEVFDEAPVQGSDNSEAHEGIHLHLMHSETGIAHPDLIGSDLENWAEVSAVREDHYGDPGDSAALREAKQLVFRYALIADTMSGADDTPAFGLAEGGRGRGQGLVVAAGNVLRATQDLCDGGAPCWVGFVESLSGAFMHELGHTLALRHGGEDDDWYKPNYLSVMSYSHAVPWNATTDRGSSVYQYWELDYSREALPALDEDDLHEPSGLSGTAGRALFWSHLGVGGLTRAVTLGGGAIDWNQNRAIEDLPLDADINRREAIDPELLTVLLGSSDWDRLGYAPGPRIDTTTASPAESAATAEPAPELTEEIDLAEVQAYIDADWVDLSDLVETDLWVTKENGATVVTAGGSTLYTVVVENAGPSAVTGATVRDRPPPELDCSWTCTPSMGADCTPGPVAGDLVDLVGLPVGASVSYAVDCLVAADAIGPIANRALVIPPPAVADLDPADNEAVDVDDVEGECGHPNGVVLEMQLIDEAVEVRACTVVTLGGELEVVAPGSLVVESGGRVEVRDGFSVGSGAEVRFGGFPDP